jgi:demethylmenaquinone methyltransferase/2-methoxy-6-polyprenyl-1,4-benzoquinol methylase
VDGESEFVSGPSLSKSPDRIAGMFDAIAGRYDLLNHLLSAGIDRRWRKRAIDALQLSGRECVLDLCTGTADLAMAARQAPRPAASVVGVDFADAMLRVGQRKLARARLDRSVALVRGDATAIPIADASIDAVTMAFGIRNVERPEAACREIRRVLRPNGRLAILEFAIPANAVLRIGYLWYFRHVLPRIGKLISRDDVAYGYLPASVGAFATPGELVTILRQSGFSEIRAVPLTFGIVYLYTACRA